MPAPKLDLQVRMITPQVSAIDLKGEVNGFADAALAEAFSQASGKGVQAIVLNFEKLEYMNSSGIGLLVTLLIRAQRQKQRLLAAGLSDHYREIFQLTRLNEAIGIYASEADAVAVACA